ncbi:MAG: IS1182 family transposase [Armatimonadota bacterium]
MSQGKKRIAPPSLFIPSGDPYAHIPKRHFYERLAALVDLSFVRELTASLYAEKLGRPSIDPVVFFQCMLVAFFENIVADRALEFRLADSLVIRKYLGYSLDERTPDESTLRKTRQLIPEETFRLVFMQVLAQCAERGLVRGRALGMDSTTVDASASMDSLVQKELACTDEEFMLALKRQDMPAATPDAAKAADKDRKGKASKAEWSSPTDPDARVMQHADKHTHLSYHLDATVDLESGVIVAVGADYADHSDQQTCLDRVDEAVEHVEAVGGTPQMLVADKGHHSGENLRGIEERGLIPLISSPCQTRGAEGFRREDFTYAAESDSYTCPAGQALTRRTSRQDTKLYQARGAVCRVCPHFGVCTKSKTGRGLSISHDDEIIQQNRARVHHPDARPILMIRRQRGEAPFGYWKQFGGLGRLTGHGLTFATKKALIAGIGWNLLRLLKVDMLVVTSFSALVGIVLLFLTLWQAIRGAAGEERYREPLRALNEIDGGWAVKKGIYPRAARVGAILRAPPATSFAGNEEIRRK